MHIAKCQDRCVSRVPEAAWVGGGRPLPEPERAEARRGRQSGAGAAGGGHLAAAETGDTGRG